MRFVLIVVGAIAMLLGGLTLVLAKSAIHEILGGQGIIGGLTLLALGALIDAVERGSARIVNAIEDRDPTNDG